MNTLVQDLRYGARQLVRSPVFACVAALTLAIGIGANTAIFSFVYGVAFVPYEYPEPDELVHIFSAVPEKGWNGANTSLADYADWRRDNTSFVDLGVYHGQNANLTGDGPPDRVEVTRASASLLPVLGFEPRLGRVHTEAEDVPGAPSVVALSDAFWQARFGGDPAVIGRSIVLDGTPTTIIGVLPPEMLRAWGDDDLWAPLGDEIDPERRGNRSYGVMGRLKPGVSMRQAEVEMVSIASRLEAEYPATNKGWTVNLRTLLEEDLEEDERVALSALVGAVGFVLLIACANVANLLLARANVRQREIAIRAALGAQRGRLVRQMLTESVLLAVMGGALGVLFAKWGLDALLAALAPDNLPDNEIAIDGTALVFTVVIALVSAFVFGLAPALHATRARIGASMNDGGRSGTAGGRRRRRRDVLVVGQITLALVLVTCAGLMIRSFLYLRGVDGGFDAAGLLTLRLNLSGDRYADADGQHRFLERALAEIGAVPGVEGVGAVSTVPLGNSSSWRTYTAEGDPRPEGEEPHAGYVVASHGYFEAMRIQVLRGRSFDPRDREGAARVVLVNEHMAETTWPGQDPVGRRLKYGGADSENPWRTVVGVVRDVRHSGLTEPPRAETYEPYAQVDRSGMTFVVRTALDPASAVPDVRKAIWTVDPNLPLYRIRTMEDLVRGDIGVYGVFAGILAVLAAAALVLASVGLYGVMSYNVTQRTQEIGVRMALGAQARNVVGLVIVRSAWLTLIGIVCGVGLALVCARSLGALMYGVGPADPLTFAGVGLLLLFVALLATYLPARRATRIDPIEALRYE